RPALVIAFERTAPFLQHDHRFLAGCGVSFDATGIEPQPPARELAGVAVTAAVEPMESGGTGYAEKCVLQHGGILYLTPRCSIGVTESVGAREEARQQISVDQHSHDQDQVRGQAVDEV